MLKLPYIIIIIHAEQKLVLKFQSGFGSHTYLSFVIQIQITYS